MCTHDGCRRPFATLRGGVLVIQSRHGGETHTNEVAVAELVRLWLGEDAARVLLLAMTLLATDAA